MMRRRLVLALALASYGLLAACASILGIEPPPSDGGLLGDGSTFFDATIIPCALLDAQPPDAAPATYSPFSDTVVDDAGARTFNFYNLGTLPVFAVGDASIGYAGGTFDGDHVYFATASNNGVMLRHQADASVSGQWETFDPAGMPGGRQAYEGAVFDGRYVYFVPRDSDMLRYDTTASFASASGWSSFDVRSLSDAGKVPYFSGATFDGRYVYFAPHLDGNVARYDTQPPAPDAGASDAGADADAGPVAPFDNLADWAIFDTKTNVDSNAVEYRGAVFDGRFVYFIPQGGTVLVRYDTTTKNGFTVSAGGWSFYNLAMIANAPKNFSTGVFDGRYLYLIPQGTPTLAVRYDTKGSFTATASYAAFDVSTVLPALDGGVLSFLGGAFDGRYVYFIPAYDSGAEVLRYDTLSPFAAVCAWEAYDIGTHQPGLGDFFGAVYDGEQLLYIPRSSYVMSFTSKIPGSMPALPHFSGSFF